jgi:hypothetical protein
VFKDQVLERNDTGFDRNGEEEPKYTEGNDPVFLKVKMARVIKPTRL